VDGDDETLAELKRLGRGFRAQRRAKGLSQEQLGELAGVHRNYIGQIERGERNVKAGMLIKLARAMRVSPAKFFDLFG
jgi:XRE family transcriptional regulator, regulator of sulfur utilization